MRARKEARSQQELELARVVLGLTDTSSHGNIGAVNGDFFDGPSSSYVASGSQGHAGADPAHSIKIKQVLDAVIPITSVDNDESVASHSRSVIPRNVA